MAIFIPKLEYIKTKLRVKPTEGEWYLLNLLTELDDTYTVYFEPYINIDHPDIVIMRQGGGVYIIEVKDWRLDAYTYDYTVDTENPFGIMYENNGGHKIKTPFSQVKKYKDDLFNLFSKELYVKNLKERRKVYSCVNIAVFFYNASQAEVNLKFKVDNDKKEIFKHIQLWGKEKKIILDTIKKKLERHYFFDRTIYNELTYLFTLSEEELTQNEPFFFQDKPEQLKYIQSKAGEHKRVKGVAGSGKTVVLAQRAVNAYERTNSPVLILTFNITLRNCIRDKISRAQRGGTKGKHDIIHVHMFALEMLNKYGLIGPSLQEEEKNMDFVLTEQMQILLNSRSRVNYEKYQTILIDEVQDFKYEWLCAIEDCFLAENGEFILFGDEKQNIYGRDLDQNRLPRTRNKGKWGVLKQSQRMNTEISDLAMHFQEEFLGKKYEITPITHSQINMFNMNEYAEKKIVYQFLPSINRGVLYNIIENIGKEGGRPISPNDICILSEKIEGLRKFEQYLRIQRNRECNTTFEQEEEYQAIKKVNDTSYNEECKKLEKKYKRQLTVQEKEELCNKYRKQLEMHLHGLRRIKKFAFQMNCGAIKMSTIHSFKGWEINTLVLIISSSEVSDELIYTALTRCKNNLYIINLENEKYHIFFEKEINKG